jgi:AcrR family transcriptional regulator
MSTRPAASGKTYHHGDLRRRLLEEAILMLRDGGLEALSLRRLAERVGVSQTALYHHFHDKQGLLCAMGEEGIRRFDEALAAVA